MRDRQSGLPICLRGPALRFMLEARLRLLSHDSGCRAGRNRHRGPRVAAIAGVRVRCRSRSGPGSRFHQRSGRGQPEQPQAARLMRLVRCVRQTLDPSMKIAIDIHRGPIFFEETYGWHRGNMGSRCSMRAIFIGGRNEACRHIALGAGARGSGSPVGLTVRDARLRAVEADSNRIATAEAALYRFELYAPRATSVQRDCHS